VWTNKFHIVHFSTVHPLDDTRIFAKECVSLAKAGFAVTLVAAGSGTSRTIEGVLCRTIPVPRGRAGRMTAGQLRMLNVLLRLRADLFHFHDPELFPTALLLRLIGRRVIFDSHENISKDLGEKLWLPVWAQRVAGALGRMLERLADRFLAGVVIATPGMRSAYPTGRTALVRNLPKREEFADMPDWTQRHQLVCYLGLVSEFRGSRQIARLAARTSAQIVVAGRLPEDEEDKLREEPGWALVKYCGVLDRGQVVHLLAKAKIGLALLLPMNNFQDSIPTKMLEYLAAGIPVVASDFTAWRALTAGVRCAVFVNPLDDDAVASAVDSLLSDPHKARMMGALGRELVLRRFVWETEFEALLNLYRSILLPDGASVRE
jgi:glycosyltransferase involved in cell wall biosynthesis